MRTILTTFATATALALAAPAAAKTYVHCLEGSPEGFNPAAATSTTAFDANGLPIYDRLVEFERGTAKTSASA